MGKQAFQTTFTAISQILCTFVCCSYASRQDTRRTYEPVRIIIYSYCISHLVTLLRAGAVGVESQGSAHGRGSANGLTQQKS